MNKSNDVFSGGAAKCSRRTLLRGLAGAMAAGMLEPFSQLAFAESGGGRLKQSVCLWCYSGFLKRSKMETEAFVVACAAMGLKSVELVGRDQWPMLKRHGLICAMAPSHGIAKGINRVENHEMCLSALRKGIDAASEAGFPNVITLSGNREGMDDATGLSNSVTALKQVAGYAEQKKVTICLELLNSIDHKDYMADSTKWCVDLVHRVASPRVKILYDIYHAAMMREDVVADIQKHADCFAHYHTGGMPGRNEIDGTQTLDYAKIMKAIQASGFYGYVGQEFIPKREDALASLKQAFGICDV